MKKHTIKNDSVSLSVDGKGRIISLINVRARTELIGHPDAAEAWRLVIPAGGHRVDFVYGSDQQPESIEVARDNAGQFLAMEYSRLVAGGQSVCVRARFVLRLDDGSDEILAHAEIMNIGSRPVDEVEFPIVGGIGGFPAARRRDCLNLVMAGDTGVFAHDCLRKGLPETGIESNHFAREHETAMVTAATGHWVDGKDGRWIDLWREQQGLYFGCHEKIHETVHGNFFFKLEKHPKETPNAPVHCYPRTTPRWLRVSALHIACIPKGKRWTSSVVTVMPHKGDWHAGADRYSEWRHTTLPQSAQTPRWMRNFVGWTEILGKTYLGEVFHDYRRCADMAIKDKQITGINLLFYYGHTKIGAEGADFDQSPAPDLGGEKGFRAMLRKLHANGIRVMLLDHLHRYVNHDIPEFKELGLTRYAVRDPAGNIAAFRKWAKETGRSCLFREGPTPCWVEMCPACVQWREHYVRQLTRLIELGVDGVEMDLFGAGVCHAGDHGHSPGASMVDAKLAFIREARAHVKRLNPDFALFAESLCPDARGVADGFYSVGRYRNENERIYRYLFPEITEQAVLVGNYAYDQVNKALMLGIGIETEIWGLRKTCAEACPELARYIGEVNRLRRRYAHILMRGRFKDTLGARVNGSALYSVIEGTSGAKAMVLRNHTAEAQPVKAAFLQPLVGTGVLLRRPFVKEKRVRLPVKVTLKPYEAAVLLCEHH